MTDKEVFKKLAKIKNFDLLEDKEKFLICDYIHYSIQIDLEKDEDNELGDVDYIWGGQKNSEYDSDYSEPWGFETTGKNYGEIFNNVKISLLQKKEDYGILVKVEASIEEDSFCFTFWDCKEEEIDFSKLPDFSCSANSLKETSPEEYICALLRKKEFLEYQQKQTEEQLEKIVAELEKFNVSSFEE